MLLIASILLLTISIILLLIISIILFMLLIVLYRSCNWLYWSCNWLYWWYYRLQNRWWLSQYLKHLLIRGPVELVAYDQVCHWSRWSIAEKYFHESCKDTYFLFFFLGKAYRLYTGIWTGDLHNIIDEISTCNLVYIMFLTVLQYLFFREWFSQSVTGNSSRNAKVHTGCQDEFSLTL